MIMKKKKALESLQTDLYVMPLLSKILGKGDDEPPGGTYDPIGKICRDDRFSFHPIIQP